MFSFLPLARNRLTAMDIVKGSLDEISRPASISRSRSGSRASSASSVEKPKFNLTVGSLEVLTPEPGLSKVPSPLSEDIWSSPDSSFTLTCNDIYSSSERAIPGNVDMDGQRTTTPVLTSESKITDKCKRRMRSLQPADNRGFDHDNRVTAPLQPLEKREPGRGRTGTEISQIDMDEKSSQPLQPSENRASEHDRIRTPHLRPSEKGEIEQGRTRTHLQPLDSNETDQDKRTALHKEVSRTDNKSKQTGSTKDDSDIDEHEKSDEENEDPKLAEAIRKMKTLDKILAKKQIREKEVKNLGQQMRKKLWEELQIVTRASVVQTQEESLNTRRFMALTPQSQDTTDTDSLREDVEFTPVFHTQLPPDEGDWLDTKYRDELRDLPNRSGSIPHMPRKKDKTKNSKKDFVKRNIELARDAGNPIILMDDEKQRIEDLLREPDDAFSADTDSVVDVSKWIVPGEGYTPEPEEYEQLATIDAELQAVLSGNDISSVLSPQSSIQDQGYQDSFSSFNVNSEVDLFESIDEVLPGEMALRLTKEARLQQARLKDIEQQLENLEKNQSCPGDGVTILSEEQLKVLLDECCSSQRSSSSSTTFFALSDVGSPTDRAAASARLSPTALARLLEEAAHDVSAVSIPGKHDPNGRATFINEGNKLECEDETEESETYSRSSSQTRTATWEETVDEPKNDCDTVGYFMAKALGLGKLSRPSFLNELLYCANTANEVCREADIPGIPEETRGGELLHIEDLMSV